MTLSSRQYTQERLDYYYKVINKTIMAKQNASSGLMPASTAITVSQHTHTGRRSKDVLIGGYRAMETTRMPGSGMQTKESGLNTHKVLV